MILPLSRDRLGELLRDLHPGSFAFVMATGIVSIGEEMFGHRRVSLLLLAIATAGSLHSARRPVSARALGRGAPAGERAVGCFTFGAGSNVLAVLLTAAGAGGLALLGAGARPLLAYGIQAGVALAPTRPLPEAAVNGTWLIWVVGTQSVSITASTLGPGLGVDPRVAALAAVSPWAAGALLYLLLMGILARLVRAPLDPAEVSPPCRIGMGATAITVLAGATCSCSRRTFRRYWRSVRRSEASRCFLGLGDVVLPVSHPAHGLALPQPAGAPLRADALEHGLPPGMYAVATEAYSRAAGLPLLPGVAQAGIWLALAAWLGVAAWMVASWFCPRCWRRTRLWQALDPPS